MGKPVKTVQISNTALATSANPITTTTVNQTFNQGFQTGNTLMHNLQLRYSGNLNLTGSVAGSISTRGGLGNIRGFWLQSNGHGVLVNGLDGLHLHHMAFYRNGVRPFSADVPAATTGTPDYDYFLPVDFRDRKGARPNDCSIDMARVQYMEARLNLAGVQPDFIVGGTYSTIQNQAANWEMEADIDPGPVAANDVPLFKPYLDIAKELINQTATAYSIKLPYGGRLIRRYALEQRLATGANGALQANTIIGVNDNDRVSLSVGTYAWRYRVQWATLQSKNQHEMGLVSAMPVGCGVLNFALNDSRGYLGSEVLGLNNAEGSTPQVELNVDVTSVTNGQLHIVTDAMVPIPLDAVRQAAQAPAAG